jgi:hypothetical protein
MKNTQKLLLMSLAIVLSACSHIRVTKTGMGIYPPTNPTTVEIRATVPQDRSYDEIGMVSCDILGDPARSYNLIRQKAAAVGADAVILSNQMAFGARLIISGAAIKYKTQSSPPTR